MKKNRIGEGFGNVVEIFLLFLIFFLYMFEDAKKGVSRMWRQYQRNRGRW